MGGTSAADEYCSIGARLWQSTDKHHVVASLREAFCLTQRAVHFLEAAVAESGEWPKVGLRL